MGGTRPAFPKFRNPKMTADLSDSEPESSEVKYRHFIREQSVHVVKYAGYAAKAAAIYVLCAKTLAHVDDDGAVSRKLAKRYRFYGLFASS
jgi:hypothetical protein